MKYFQLLKWSLWTILFLIVISLSWYFLESESFKVFYDSTAKADNKIERYKFAISTIGIMAAVLALTLNALNAIESIMIKKAENSFSLLKSFDEPSISAARDITRNLKKQKKETTAKDFEEEILKEENEKSVIMMMNFFEKLALSIVFQSANEEILKIGLSDTYCNIFERFENWINANTDEKMKFHLKWLYERWRKPKV